MVRARAESDAVAGGMPAVVSPTRRTLTLTSVRSSLRTRAVLEPFGIWVLTRVLMVALTYTGVILFGNALHDPQHPSFLHALLPAWANARSHGWDTQWYTDIARRGYDWSKSVGTSPTAFLSSLSASHSSRRHFDSPLVPRRGTCDLESLFFGRAVLSAGV